MNNTLDTKRSSGKSDPTFKQRWCDEFERIRKILLNSGLDLSQIPITTTGE